MRWLVGLLLSIGAAYSIIGGIKLYIQPSYIIIQMPSECKGGSEWSYTPPVEEYRIDTMRWPRRGP